MDMTNTQFAKEQIIFLEAKPGTYVHTALAEAIIFCTVNQIDECQLDYDGFLFDITPMCNYKDKLQEYYNSDIVKMNKEWIEE